MTGTRFSIGSAPPASITKMILQARRGETRQDYKDTRSFPLVAPSCALLFQPCRLPDTCPPFSLTGSVALSHSSHCRHLGSM
ncbi:hypothetical protein DB994_24050 [Salmonella enterica]|nr:hypothetical protein [Salmonella enterica]EBX4352457.1 hypothetical protein [Salmonella enterica subsp. enterica serovar Typhimurium]ECE5833446.1 hypothetical protein [Salmonella enterica subsp. enterica]HAG7798212.1 hypothetical protein [Escherichia coli]HBX2507145.1 hypothetical protein [Klebsiella pneumoniae]